MMDDYRSIPVDVLRDFARTRAEMTSIRAAGIESGLSHSAFHKFIRGRTQPQPRVRRLLGLWYLKHRGDAHDIDVARPYAAALAVLLSDVPTHAQDAASAHVVESLRAVHEEHGPVPRWLELLLAEKGKR